MLRFCEGTNQDKRFAKLIYNKFWNEQKGKFDFLNRKLMSGIPGWPEGLDTENLELYSVGNDHVTVVAGGDWQEMTLVSVVKSYGKNKLVWRPFDSYTEQNTEQIRQCCDVLLALASE